MDLACELKRRASKNINGNVTRKMRECLIRLYYTLGEIKNDNRTIALEKELEQVTLQVKELKENKLREKIEQVKRNIGTTSITGKDLREISTQTSNNKSVETATIKKSKKRKIEEKQRTISKIKRNSQPKINSSEGKIKGKRFKRKLSYPLDSRQKEMEDVEISPMVGTNSSRKTGKQTRKRKERIAWPDVNAQVQQRGQ